MDDIETRLATLEAKFAAMEERRRKIIPPELYDDPNIQELAREAGKGMVDRWRLSLAQNGVSMAHARFEEAKQKIVRDQKIADEKEAAEIAAAIEFYEQTGQSPEGYDIEEIAACRSIA
jgi:hypothetical protein